MTVEKPTGKGGLPAHWQRGRLRAALATLLVALAFTYALRGLGRADRLDNWWLRARFTVRERLRPPAPPDPAIVLIRMDDRSLDQWPEPTIAWGPHLADAIDRLTTSGAKVIALDWVQPNPVSKWFPGADERLEEALSRSDRVVWVKLVRWDGSVAHWIAPHPALLYAQPSAALDPDATLGFAELKKEESIVTSLPPVLPGDPSQVSFAARIVERYLGAKGERRGSQWEIPGKMSVPLRQDGTVLIDYADGTGKGAPFSEFPLYDLTQRPNRPDPRFKDKIVLIGVTFTGGNDQHPVPFLAGLAGTRMAFGTDIQANFVRTLLSSHPLREPGANGLWALAMGLGLVGLLAFYRLRWLPAALLTLGAAVAWLLLAFGLFVAWDVALPIDLPLTSLLLSGGLMGSYLALSEGRERRHVLGLWGRYQDPRLVDYLLRYPQARGGEGHDTEVTVLFADLKNFTKTVEALPPGAALQVLNRYLALLSAVILEYNGVVDKYLGDGLMAQWGAPATPGAKTVPDHRDAAVRACLEIQRRARDLTASLADPEGHEVAFGLRLTLHSGPVVVGWVGATRLEFTIIGDTVNVTSRLQETAKQLDCEFLISENTYAGVRDWARTGKEAEVEIRGRKQPLRVYEILDTAEDTAAAEAPADRQEEGLQGATP